MIVIMIMILYNLLLNFNKKYTKNKILNILKNL